MREIKFRAWYYEEMKNKDWIERYIEEGSSFNEIENLMQFTGISDKNGVEIYEGDIVSKLMLNCYDANGELDVDECIRVNYDFGVAEYMQRTCVFKLARRQYKERLTDQWNNCIEIEPSTDFLEFEVIGNIYENAELLDAK